MKILAVTAVLTALSGAAMAQQSIHSGMPDTAGTAPFATETTGNIPVAALTGQSPHNAEPDYLAGVPATFAAGDMVAVGGSVHAGTVASLNSLPAGFVDGMAANAYAQSVQQYFATVPARGSQTAARQ